MSNKADEIAALLSPTVAAMHLELLGIEYLPAPGGAVLRLYIDVPEHAAQARSVGIEDCETVSREVSAQLDVEDPITGNYTLEVSSPGLERPLFTAAHFVRFVGDTAKVTLKLPQDGRRRLQGKILRVQDQQITFSVDGAEFVVDVNNVDKAKLVPDWVALGLAPAQDKSGQDRRPGKQKKTPNSAAVGKPNSTIKAAVNAPSDAE